MVEGRGPTGPRGRPALGRRGRGRGGRTRRVGPGDTPPAFQTIVAWGCYSEGSECYFLPYFNPDTNTNMNLVGYEYKTDSSNSDSNPDTFSI